MNHGHDPHDRPRTVLEQIAEILKRRTLLLGEGLMRSRVVEKVIMNRTRQSGGPDGHGHLPAMCAVVADGEFGHQRQGEAAHDELRDVDGDKPEGVELGALVESAVMTPPSAE